MTTVSAADMLGNDVIREEILQKLRENTARLQQEGTTLPPQASQDLISISDEARRRLEEQKAAAGLPQTTEQAEQLQPENQTAQTAEEPPLLSGESASGVRVDISATEAAEGDDTAPAYHAVLNGKDGSSFTLNFSGSVSIAAGEGGLWSVYHADLGVTRLYGSDGSYTDTAGNMLDPDGDIIMISTGADEISLGDGDNLVFALGDDAVITAGNGTNEIVLGKSHGSSILMGDGDNLLSLSEAKNSLIMLGDGSNDISIHGIATGDSTLSQSYLSWGKGDTTLVLGSNSMSSIVGGDGDNDIAIGILSNGNLVLGHGDNDVSVTLMNGNSGVTAGDGQNNFYIARMENTAAAIAGNGNNSFFVTTMQDSSGLTVGDGDNFILVTEMLDNASITAGNGHNIIRVLSAMETVSIDASTDGGYNGVLVDYTYRDVMRNAAGNLTGSANASLEDFLAAAVEKLEQLQSRRRSETMEDIATERAPVGIDDRAAEAVQRASEASQEAVERAEAA